MFNGIDASDRSGVAVSAGDFNGDGVDDLLIGAFFGQSGAGETYVVYGSNSAPISGEIELGTGADATIYGIVAGDRSGGAVGSGDFNGDGVDDMLIGAYSASPNSQAAAGETYIIYGNRNTPISGSVNLGTTANAIIKGIDANDLSGFSVGSGDFNGDGVDDVLIGAYQADPNGQSSAGETYVVYGSSSAPLSGSINQSTNADITINGIDTDDWSGFSVGSGDFNGDGVDDVLIGAYQADPNGQSRAGETYIIYGSSGSPLLGAINLSNSDVTLNGIDANDLSGVVVRSGDFNGDGVDDVLIGANGADPNSAGQAGETYIVYGSQSSPLAGALNLSGGASVTINGIGSNDESGYSVSSGDFNGDGVDDVLIGAFRADPDGKADAGESYKGLPQMVFGGRQYTK